MSSPSRGQVPSILQKVRLRIHGTPARFAELISDCRPESPSPEVRTAGTYILAVGFYTPIW